MISSEPDVTLAYRRALGAFATGVTVITALDDDLAAGLTVNSFTSVSLAPPLVLWCLGDRSDRRAIFSTVEMFGVNVLAADARAIADRFAWGDWRISAADIDGPFDPPRLKGRLTYLACRTRERIVVGDHLLIIGEVMEFETQPGEGLLFFRGGYGRATTEKS